MSDNGPGAMLQRMQRLEDQQARQQKDIEGMRGAPADTQLAASNRTTQLIAAAWAAGAPTVLPQAVMANVLAGKHWNEGDVYTPPTPEELAAQRAAEDERDRARDETNRAKRERAWDFHRPDQR